jgi:hypothetical protein
MSTPYSFSSDALPMIPLTGRKWMMAAMAKATLLIQFMVFLS